MTGENLPVRSSFIPENRVERSDLRGIVANMTASTVAQYLAALPADRRAALSAVRKTINENLLVQQKHFPAAGTGRSAGAGATGRAAALLVSPETGRAAGAACRQHSLYRRLGDRYYYHFDLQAHDPATAERLWKKRLLTVKAEAGGHIAQARLLGQEGDAVWMFLDDGPVALSIRDGSKLADRGTIEQRNPALRDLVPKDSDFYAYDKGLVITAADARRFRVRAPDSMAEPYTPPNEDSLQQPQVPLARWDPGHPTRKFLVRQMMLDGRWIGFFDEKEAADAAHDDFGRKISTGEPGSNPDRIFFETSRARRTFWSARVGKTKEFPEGTHDRLFDVARIAGAPEYLDAGLLIRQGRSRRCG